MKIEKGKKYRCLGWYGCYFTGGNYYVSDKDGYLVNNHGESLLIVSAIERFELVEGPSIEDLLKRIEILESMVGSFSVTHCMGFEHPKQPCETVAKFKRIADHAQAITNEIASPKN